MKFSLRHKTTKEIIITVEYKRGENKWLLAIRTAIEAKANLRFADLRSADLSSADLGSANLRFANLRFADLRFADLDFSSGITFRCSSFGFKADLRLAAQLAYHFCRIDFGECEEAKKAQAGLRDLANKFHRVTECGEIPEVTA